MMTSLPSHNWKYLLFDSIYSIIWVHHPPTLKRIYILVKKKTNSHRERSHKYGQAFVLILQRGCRSLKMETGIEAILGRLGENTEIQVQSHGRTWLQKKAAETFGAQEEEMGSSMWLEYPSVLLSSFCPPKPVHASTKSPYITSVWTWSEFLFLIRL